MINIHCHKCAKLLYIVKSGNIEAEVICPDCRMINYAGRENQVIGLRGSAFQMVSVDCNCKKCKRLLQRTTGSGIIEITCKYCHETNLFNITEMKHKVYGGRQSFIPEHIQVN